MTDSVEFRLEGIESLLGKLESITYDLKRKGGRAALRKAANVVAKKAKQNAARIDDPDTGRKISANVAVRWNGRLFKRSGALGFRVGVLQGAILINGGDKSASSPTPHWRLIEFGTQKMHAHPVLRPALADNIQEVTSTFISEYEKAIDRAIARAARS